VQTKPLKKPETDGVVVDQKDECADQVPLPEQVDPRSSFCKALASVQPPNYMKALERNLGNGNSTLLSPSNDIEKVKVEI